MSSSTGWNGHPNCRRNLEGNVDDEDGGSYYVIDADGEEAVAGPFGVGSYAVTVAERFEEKRSWPDDLDVVYSPEGVMGV